MPMQQSDHWIHRHELSQVPKHNIRLPAQHLVFKALHSSSQHSESFAQVRFYGLTEIKK